MTSVACPYSPAEVQALRRHGLMWREDRGEVCRADGRSAPTGMAHAALLAELAPARSRDLSKLDPGARQYLDDAHGVSVTDDGEATNAEGKQLSSTFVDALLTPFLAARRSGNAGTPSHTASGGVGWAAGR